MVILTKIVGFIGSMDTGHTLVIIHSPIIQVMIFILDTAELVLTQTSSSTIRIQQYMFTVPVR